MITSLFKPIYRFTLFILFYNVYQSKNNYDAYISLSVLNILAKIFLYE